MENGKGIRRTYDCDVKEDDLAIFYSRDMGGRTVVLIPKDRFTLDETEATYVLTLKIDN